VKQCYIGECVSSLVYSPNGKIFVGLEGGDIKILAGRSLTEKEAFKGDKPLFSLALSRDGKLLAVGREEEVEVRDAVFGEKKYSLPCTDATLAVAFNRNGKLLAVAGSGEVGIFNALTAIPIKIHKGLDKINCLTFHPDSKLLVTGSRNSLRVWNVSVPVIATLVKKITIPGYSVAFNPDGKLLASGDDEGVKLWNIKTWKPKEVLVGGAVNSVAFSPDGKYLATGNDDTVKLWDMGSKALAKTLTGHTDIVTSVAFSPDGKWIASGSADKTVCVWEV
jgi:WD40 repeat protein